MWGVLAVPVFSCLQQFFFYPCGLATAPDSQAMGGGLWSSTQARHPAQGTHLPNLSVGSG